MFQICALRSGMGRPSRRRARGRECTIASLFLGLQHATLPLILDGRFVLWRALMYLPFAFYIGAILKLRPRLLPFLVIGHALIDLATVAVYFTLA